MLTRQIPASGEEVPAIGLGTWQVFDVGPRATERATLQEVLDAFAASAARPMVDTSPMYGNAETVLGDLMAARDLRPTLFVATKVWTSGRAAGIQQMEASMRKLRVESVDLMQVHNLVDVETHLDTLRGWKEDGRVRYVGVTHYTASAHEALAQVISTAHRRLLAGQLLGRRAGGRASAAAAGPGSRGRRDREPAVRGRWAAASPPSRPVPPGPPSLAARPGASCC